MSREGKIGIKTWVKKHEKGILFGLGIVVGIATTIIVVKSKKGAKMIIPDLVDLSGKNVITWAPSSGKGFMSLERVKETLDANANNGSSFAIFREGPDPNAYIGIKMSDDVIMK